MKGTIRYQNQPMQGSETKNCCNYKVEERVGDASGIKKHTLSALDRTVFYIVTFFCVQSTKTSNYQVDKLFVKRLHSCTHTLL